MTASMRAHLALSKTAMKQPITQLECVKSNLGFVCSPRGDSWTHNEHTVRMNDLRQAAFEQKKAPSNQMCGGFTPVGGVGRYVQQVWAVYSIPGLSHAKVWDVDMESLKTI
jgi:hypothetical protein